MDNWGNAMEGRGFLFYDNIELQVDDDDDRKISNPRKSVNEWDMVNPNLNTIDGNIEFMESDFPEIITNSLSSDPSLGCLATEISGDSSKTVSSLLGELEAFTSVNKSSNGKSLSQTDPRLKGLADSGEINNCKFSKESSILSSKPSKRARKENLCGPVFVCQVYGCNKDLSSSKDYYKRHKVCDVHSKASKVFVNGIEQRFCQQCSRFHLLGEFDDGKRSCRKRLAGHNERRRKPHVVPCSGKSYRLFQYSQEGPTYSGKNVSKSSRALSLLSADQWYNFSSHSSASIPMAVPLFITQDHDHHRLHHHSSYANEQQSYSSGPVGPCFDWLGTRILPNASVSQSMESINGGSTVNLTQLSAHLQRVEQQKNYMLVKPENDIFC